MRHTLLNPAVRVSKIITIDVYIDVFEALNNLVLVNATISVFSVNAINKKKVYLFLNAFNVNSKSKMIWLHW